METLFNVIQIALSLTILLLILSQVKEGGSGLFGAAQATGRTRRGLEKTLFNFTVAVAGIFLVVSIISVRVG